MKNVKPNPKKDKSARRKRNPLLLLGTSVDGSRSRYRINRTQCIKCSLRSAIPGETFCHECKYK